MQELVGRLTSLDPRASETLKVVSYFDALVASGAGIEAIVRGAAVLSGVPAAARTATGTVRIGPRGDRLDPVASTPRGASAAVDASTAVWIERDGTPHENDAMVLERFALALALTRGRTERAPEAAVAIAIDASRSADDRGAALARLGLSSHDRVRVVATPAGAAAPTGSSALVAAAHGPVRATIVCATTAPPEGTTAGLGSVVASAALPTSWASAAAALRLTDRDRPVVDAEDLGALLPAAMSLAASGAAAHDVERIAELDERTRNQLRTLVEADSIRSAATTLGMHHSTLQARHEALTAVLGYDPRSPVGRARFEFAELVRRVR